MAETNPTERAGAAPAPPLRSPVWVSVGALGLALTVTSIAMLISRWLPWHSLDDYSLYMMAGGTIDSLTLITVGTVCLCAALVALEAGRPARLFAGVCIVLAIAVVAIYAGLLSALPGVAREAAQSSFDARMVRLGIMRASLAAAVSFFLYLWFAWTAWRLSRPDSEPSR